MVSVHVTGLNLTPKYHTFSVFSYACLKDRNSSEIYMCEEGFVESLRDILGGDLEVIGKIEGRLVFSFFFFFVLDVFLNQQCLNED